MIENFKKNKFQNEEVFVVDGNKYTYDQVWNGLSEHLTQERVDKILDVCEGRTNSFVTVMENIYDMGNLSAVMRSAEAFGYYRMHVIEYQNIKFKAARRVSQGTEKWMWSEVFSNTKDSIDKLKSEGFSIYTTSLDTDLTIEDIDFSKKSAVIFGNEKHGVSKEALDLADSVFRLPMKGFAQSFNISVAAALTFSYCYYNRKNNQSENFHELSTQEKKIIAANYALRSNDHPGKILKRKY